MELLHQLEEPKIKHDFREQNRVADLLARNGQMLIDDKLFEEWTVPPTFVLEALQVDKEGTSVVRCIKSFCNLPSAIPTGPESLLSVSSNVVDFDVLTYFI